MNFNRQWNKEQLNFLTIRKNDYLSDFTYKVKIDVITDALLLKEVFELFKTTYLGAMTCDSTSQIDLRLLIK